MMTTMTSEDLHAAGALKLLDRLFGAVLGMVDIHTIYVGDRLGLYEALAAAGDATPAELASATGTTERYVREWLEQQAVSALLAVDDPSADPAARRYALPAGHAEVLTDRDSLIYLAAFARMMAGVVRPLPAVIEAFRSGGGVPYADYDAGLLRGPRRHEPRRLPQLARRASGCPPWPTSTTA